MPTATRERKQLQTRDLDMGAAAPERVIAVEKKGRKLLYTWPCGQEFEISQAKLAAVVDALDNLPPLSRHVSFAVVARGLYTRWGDGVNVTFTPEGKDAVRAHSSYEDESALLPMADLRAAVAL